MATDMLHWGRTPQLVFENLNEYYRALGHLTNEKAYSISYEYNKKNGSYSDACRIHILSRARKIPNAFERKMTTAGRINCNDYVDNLIKKHRFAQSGNVYLRNFDDVLSTVPNEYISDFLIGYEEATDEEKPKRVCYTTEAIDTSKKSLKQYEQPSKVATQHSPRSARKGKRDYIAQYIKDFEIGEAGESLVYEYERAIIEVEKKNGTIGKDVFVKWVSREDDSAGYDILSYDVKTNAEKYIEVKSTSAGKNTPFYISDNELKFSKTNAEKYCIYRVYGLKNDDSASVGFYVINGDLENQENFELSKNDYLVKVKSE